MSSIPIPTKAAGTPGKVIREEAKPMSAPASEKPRSSDQEMMYAWSIGVTGVARKMGENRQDWERCPPEVYIG